jgi:hypothetical protein
MAEFDGVEDAMLKFAAPDNPKTLAVLLPNIVKFEPPTLSVVPFVGAEEILVKLIPEFKVPLKRVKLPPSSLFTRIPRSPLARIPEKFPLSAVPPKLTAAIE